MAFIKPYYDHDHKITKNEQLYGRLKSLELIDNVLNGNTTEDSQKSSNQKLSRQKVLDSADPALFSEDDAQSASSRAPHKLKGIRSLIRRIFRWSK
jgi:hypothetical protein